MALKEATLSSKQKNRREDAADPALAGNGMSHDFRPQEDGTGYFSTPTSVTCKREGLPVEELPLSEGHVGTSVETFS